MDTTIYLVSLLMILILAFLLTSVSSYITFIRMYFSQVLFILLLFFLSYKTLFVDDIPLLISFIFAIAIRLVFIPLLMRRFVIKWSLQAVERKPYFGSFANIVLMVLGILLSYLLSIKIFGELNHIFWASLVVLFSGFIILINHKKIIGDILGFLMLENALFLLSIGLSHAVNIYIEFAIMADIVMGLTVLAISVIQIKQIYGSLDIEKLSQLRD